jgi:hypothetical protein
MIAGTALGVTSLVEVAACVVTGVVTGGPAAELDGELAARGPAALVVPEVSDGAIDEMWREPSFARAPH